MKLRKIFASVTAVALAASTVSVMPVSVGATVIDKPDGTETVLGSFVTDQSTELAQYGSAWFGIYGIDSSVFSDKNNYVKVTYSYKTAPLIGDGKNTMSEVAGWGFSSYSGWYNVGAFYNDDVNLNLVPATNSKDTEFYCYLPVSDFKTGTQIAGNVQNYLAQTATVKAVELVNIGEAAAPVLPANEYKFDISSGTTEGTDYPEWAQPVRSDIGSDKTITPAVLAEDFIVTVKYTSSSRPEFVISDGSGDGALNWIRVKPNVVVDGIAYYLRSDIAAAWTAAGGKSDLSDAVSICITAAGSVLTVSDAALWSDAAADVPVTGVKLNASAIELTLTETETALLTATVEPANATDKTVTWTSSDESVAVVSANGRVTAVAAGTATITASAGKASAKCAVTVNKRAIDLKFTLADKIMIYSEDTDEARIAAALEILSAGFTDSKGEPVNLKKDVDYSVTASVSGEEVTVTVSLTEEGQKKYTADARTETVRVIYAEWQPVIYTDYTIDNTAVEVEYGADIYDLLEAVQKSSIDMIIDPILAEDHAPFTPVRLSRAGAVSAIDDSKVDYETPGTYTAYVTIDLTKVMNPGDIYIDPTLGASTGQTSVTAEFTVTVGEKPVIEEPDDPAPGETPDQPAGGWKESGGVYTYTTGSTGGNAPNLLLPTDGVDLSAVTTVSVDMEADGYAMAVLCGNVSGNWTMSDIAEAMGDKVTLKLEANGGLTDSLMIQVWWMNENVTVKISNLKFETSGAGEDAAPGTPSDPGSDDKSETVIPEVPGFRYGTGDVSSIWTEGQGSTYSSANAVSAFNRAKSGDSITIVMDSDGVISAKAMRKFASKKDVTAEFVYSGYSVTINSGDVDAGKVSALDLSNKGKFLTKSDLELMEKGVRQVNLSGADFTGIEKATLTVTMLGGDKGRDAGAYSYIGEQSYTAEAQVTVDENRTVSFEITKGGKYFVNPGESLMTEAEALSEE